MTQQFVLTLVASAVGFAAGIMFCIGNVLNTAARITDQASPRWDFSEPIARSLAAQRAQYVVGALLLVASFVLQIAAALASSTTVAALPSSLQSWPSVVLVVLVPTLLLAASLASLLYKSTMRKVLSIARPESPPAQ